MSDASFVTGLTRCTACSAALVVGLEKAGPQSPIRAKVIPLRDGQTCVVAGTVRDSHRPEVVLMEALRRIAHDGGVCPGHRVSAVCLLQDDHDRAVRFCFEGPDPADPPGDGWPWQEEDFGGGE